MNSKCIPCEPKCKFIFQYRTQFASAADYQTCVICNTCTVNQFPARYSCKAQALINQVKCDSRLIISIWLYHDSASALIPSASTKKLQPILNQSWSSDCNTACYNYLEFIDALHGSYIQCVLEYKNFSTHWFCLVIFISLRNSWSVFKCSKSHRVTFMGCEWDFFNNI